MRAAIALITALLLLPGTALAGASNLSALGAGGPGTSTPACGGYVGPGDVDTHFTHWWGLRAFSAATCGTKAVNIRRASDSTTTDINSLSTNGNLDAASIATFCASTTCTIVTAYDKVGAADVNNQATTAREPTVTANCVNTTLTCATFVAGKLLQSTASITTANGSVSYFAAKQTATNGGNRDVMSGQALFNYSAGFGTSDHPDCLAGGSGEITGAVSIGTWARVLCTQNGASSAMLENGSSTSGSLATGTGTQSAFIASSFFVGTWVESGINSTTMGATLATLDGNISAYWGI